jgi:hypothetical protein
MSALERITAILERARVAGGWIDEDVAARILAELGLDDDGAPVDRRSTPEPSSDDAPDEDAELG